MPEAVRPTRQRGASDRPEMAVGDPVGGLALPTGVAIRKGCATGFRQAGFTRPAAAVRLTDYKLVPTAGNVDDLKHDANVSAEAALLALVRHVLPAE